MKKWIIEKWKIEMKESEAVAGERRSGVVRGASGAEEESKTFKNEKMKKWIIEKMKDWKTTGALNNE